MNLRAIRLPTIVLATSTIVLMASAGDVQAIQRRFAFCMSGRCVKATGTLAAFDGGHLLYRTSCVIMVDLVQRYFASDNPGSPPPGGGWIPVRIEYGRFSIHAYSTFFEFHVIVGFPGGAVLHSYPTIPEELVFAGVASFYNRMETVPWR